MSNRNRSERSKEIQEVKCIAIRIKKSIILTCRNFQSFWLSVRLELASKAHGEVLSLRGRTFKDIYLLSPLSPPCEGGERGGYKFKKTFLLKMNEV